MRLRLLLACMAVMPMMAAMAALMPACVARAQAPQDVPRDHWAYSAVEDLAAKGLIKGYPPSGDFFGKRTVTRYEMATILQRVLARVDALLAQKADRGAAPATTNAVTAEQLAEVRRLVEEFRVELTVIGTDLQKAKEQLAALQAQVDAQGKRIEQSAADIRANRQEIAKTRDAVKRQEGRVGGLEKQAKSHTISGYLQARFEAYDTGRTSLFTPTAAGGTGQSPTIGGPAVGGPWYGFLVRRARVKISGPIGNSGRTDYGVQFDLPSFTGVNVKEGYVHIADLPARHLDFTIGQFAPPFGSEIPRSSAVRSSPERALGFSDTTASSPVFKTAQAATGGVVTPGSALPLFLNQEFDQGAMFTYAPTEGPGGSTKLFVMALNGGGTVPAGIRNQKNGIDWIARAQTTLASGRLDLGISGYYGELPVRGAPPNGAGVPAPFVNGLKELAGADATYRAPWGTTLRAEYVGGVYEVTPDRALYLPGSHAQAWYVSLRHPLTRKLDVAIKYDEFMPITQPGKYAAGFGRITLARKTLQGGLLYYLDDATRFRLWYMRGLTPYDPTAPSGPLRDRLGFITGEVQVRY